MALFDQQVLQKDVRGREVFAWSMYDFANSGYTTVVLTAVFNAYFVSVVAGKADWATFVWTAAMSFSALLIMLTAPAIGVWADTHVAKKKVMAVCTIGCVLTTAGLATAQPGMVAMAIVLIIISNYFFSIGEAVNGAFLPELARPEALGKVSGWGWSFGYFGGMLTLGLSLAWVTWAQGAGQQATEFVPVTMLITAVIFAFASLPVFWFLHERGSAGGLVADARPSAARVNFLTEPGASLRQLKSNWHELKGFPDFHRLLWCAVSYQAGITVVITLAAIYAQEVMGFKQSDTMMLVFLVNIAAALGAFGFGYIQDRIGHRLALSVTLIGWILMVLLAGLGTTSLLFWISAVIAGLCMGSSQSAGRAMAGLLAPATRLAEFYGLWAFATRLAAVIGPITYGTITLLTSGNHRLAILCTGLFFVIGLLILRGINIDRGRQAALAAESDEPAALAPTD